MSEKKELVHKPNQTIMIANGEITAVQRKAYNVILHQAQKQVKENPNKILFQFYISDLKEKAGLKATDNWHLKRDIERLRQISVETVHENGDWCIFSLIAQAEKKEDFLEIQLPEKIRQALILNDYYTTLDLMIIKNLQGKYAIIIYELAMRYQKKQIPELSVEEFREITGTSNISSYSDFNNIRKKIIEPAIEEINDKTDIRLSYETNVNVPISRGRKVYSIKFNVRLKKEKTEVVLDESPVIFEEKKVKVIQQEIPIEKPLSNESEIKKLIEKLKPLTHISKHADSLDDLIQEFAQTESEELIIELLKRLLVYKKEIVKLKPVIIGFITRIKADPKENWIITKEQYNSPEEQMKRQKEKELEKALENAKLEKEINEKIDKIMNEKTSDLYFKAKAEALKYIEKTPNLTLDQLTRQAIYSYLA